MNLAIIFGRIPTSAECRLVEWLATIRPARPLVETIRPLDSGAV